MISAVREVERRTSGDSAPAPAEVVAPRPRRGPLAAVRSRAKRFARAVGALGTVARRLAPYVRGRTSTLVLALVCTIGYMLLRLLEPWPVKLILDHVLLGAPLPASLSFLESFAGDSLLVGLVLSIIAVSVFSGFFYYWQNVLSAHLGQYVAAGLRFDLFRHLHRLDFTFHDRRRKGDLLVRLVADIRLLRNALVKIPLDLSENALLMLGMAVVMLVMDWRLALIAYAAVPLLVILIRRYRKPMKAAVRKQRRQEGSIADVINESLGAIEVVQGLGLEEQEAKRFGGANRRSLKEGVKAARLEAKLRWASHLAVGLITAAVVGMAAHRIRAGALSPGDLVVFISYLRAFARPLRRASRTTEQITRTTVAGERVFEIFDREPEVRDEPDAVEAPKLRGGVRFEGVGLRHGRYPWVLRDLELEVRPGERLGIVGPTGAGKSSLMKLLPRFYDPTEGRVLLDGHDVRSLTLSSLRRQIAFVFQEPVLFATTVAANIAAGLPGASRKQIEEAARRAGIHEVIAGLAEGYDTELGERGGTLSGGQRQCVAIARAILRDEPIVVLDEPTTGLDRRAAAMVTDALDQLMRGRTVFLITHELERLRDADRIVVLDHGRIVQEGSYDMLSSRKGLFRQLVRYGQLR
ncbi:MAG: ABC transporter ATP-binding protein [Planctomycetota bacterium]|jgi:ATP-binding cassette subfamily B protein